jgi:hypothetical protein
MHLAVGGDPHVSWSYYGGISGPMRNEITRLPPLSALRPGHPDCRVPWLLASARRPLVLVGFGHGFDPGLSTRIAEREWSPAARISRTTVDPS